MKNVIAMLNDMIDQHTGILTHIGPSEAREALFAIETQDLAVTALRQILAERKNHGKSTSFTEALDHGQRMVDLHDSQVEARKHAATFVAPAKNPVQEQDVSDLV